MKEIELGDRYGFEEAVRGRKRKWVSGHGHDHLYCLDAERLSAEIEEIGRD